MDKKKIFGAIGIVAGLAVVLFALVKGPCTGTIATAAGGAVPMKCHWSFRASALMGVLMAVAGVLELVCKSREGVIAAAVMGLALSVGIFLTLGPVIGICAKAEMLCRATAPLMKTAAGIGGVSQLLALVFSRESKPSKRF